ncbi:MAG: tRNA glutamyl-Q(34) synthetase GluQRS [Rhodocyclaceae bacterium]|nr:tRNA glutamyl-Q(34) synthetase GluQRS [Rhodocyclaceae bacterium]
MSTPLPSYRGRFAPSPTGPLHFGSLVAAVASYCEARAHGGQWLVRMEDLDRPRTVPGAADAILRALDAFGFEWTGPVMLQSERDGAYSRAREVLAQRGVLYPCACSRKEIADSSLGEEGERIYPGTCRNGLPADRVARAMRVRVSNEVISFHDRIQGSVSQNLERQVGDFVVCRADGLFAYQLAVVVDDAEQGITEVVRGADLLASTPRQIYLQRLLGYPTPSYAHVPAAVNARGEKLSKQTQAAALDSAQASAALVAALKFLGQTLPPELAAAPLRDVWRWTDEHWNLAKVPAQRTLPAPEQRLVPRRTA